MAVDIGRAVGLELPVHQGRGGPGAAADAGGRTAGACRRNHVGCPCGGAAGDAAQPAAVGGLCGDGPAKRGGALLAHLLERAAHLQRAGVAATGDHAPVHRADGSFPDARRAPDCGPGGGGRPRLCGGWPADAARPAAGGARQPVGPIGDGGFVGQLCRSGARCPQPAAGPAGAGVHDGAADDGRGVDPAAQPAGRRAAREQCRRCRRWGAGWD